MVKPTFDINEIRKQQVQDFTDFLSKLSVLENALRKKLDEVENERLAIGNELDEKKQVSERLRILIRKSEDTINENNIIVTQSKVIQGELNEKLKSLKSDESRLNVKLESLRNQERLVAEREDVIAKKEKYLDMEERRLKLFEHKLNLVLTDETIKKKLKQL